MKVRARKTVLAFPAALVLLFALASAASARSYSSSSQTFRQTWSAVTFRSGEMEMGRCALTLEGSFHSRTIAKVANSLIGYLNRQTSTCTRATIMGETLPWHARYESFTGTLPNITLIKWFHVFGVWVTEPFGGTCHYVGFLWFLWLISSGRVTSNVIDERRTIPRTGGGGLCPATITSAGTGSVAVGGGTTAITLTLI